MPFPIIIGSKTLPIKTFTERKIIPVQINPPDPSCIMANNMAGTAAMKDPILGI